MNEQVNDGTGGEDETGQEVWGSDSSGNSLWPGCAWQWGVTEHLKPGWRGVDMIQGGLAKDQSRRRCKVKFQTLPAPLQTQQKLCGLFERLPLIGPGPCGLISGQKQDIQGEHCKDLSGLERGDQPGLRWQMHLPLEPGDMMSSRRHECLLKTPPK